jgi:diguanylate cyclase (GGDEF)-like protein
MPVTFDKTFFLAVLFSLFFALQYATASGAKGTPLYQANNLSIYFNQLSSAQGLSHSSVRTIEQDQQGFIWIGTQDGLNRYDGLSVRQYNYTANDPLSLANNWISAIHSDADGRLWVASKDGINLYQSETDGFTIFDKQNQPGIKGNDYRTIAESADGTIWFGSTRKGITRFDKTTGKFSSILVDKTNEASLANQINDLMFDDLGRLWVATDGAGLSISDDQGKTFQVVSTTTEQPIPSDIINTLFQDKNGDIWIGSEDKGTFVFEPGRGVVRHFVNDASKADSLCSNAIIDILEDNQSRMFFATEDGLCQLDSDEQSFIQFRHDDKNLSSLLHDRVYSLFQDRGGVLWAGTFAGVSRWNANLPSFHLINKDTPQGGELSSNIITSFAENRNGNLFVGTWGGGVNQFDPVTRQITQFQVESDKVAGLTDNRIMSLLVDSKENLWVGTYAGGLFVKLKGQAAFRNFKHDPSSDKSISSNSISKLIELTDGTIAVATHGGGLNFYLGQDQFLSLTHVATDPTSLSDNRVLDIIEHKGTLWVATNGGGLNKYNKESHSFTVFNKEKKYQGSLASNNIYGLLSTDKHLWLATQEAGIVRVNKPTDKTSDLNFEHVSLDQGLASKVAYGLLEDDEGFIWISHSKGLTRISADLKWINHFDQTHGLQGLDFNSGAFYKLKSGRLLFGGNNGFNAFFPKLLPSNQYNPAIALVEVKKLNQVLPLSKVTNQDGVIELTYFDNVIGFKFAALDYTQPGDNIYRYKMEGLHEQWVDLGHKTSITFSHLDHGSYTLRLKGSNNDKKWSKHELTLPIYVLPPPWRTWWAYLAYIVLSLSLIALTFKAYRHKLNNVNEHKLELQREVRKRTYELECANEQLRNASFTDQLTGLKNRHYFGLIIEKEVSAIDREFHPDYDQTAVNKGAKSRLFFLMCDLDGFKAINDTYGHLAGDMVLKKVSASLLKVTRQSDTLVRWGGDEFFVMGKVANIKEVNIIAERMRTAVKTHVFDFDCDHKVNLSCSIGFSFYPFSIASPNSLNWHQIHNIADKALYYSKRVGKNKWHGIQSTDKDLPMTFSDSLDLDISQLLERHLIKFT